MQLNGLRGQNSTLTPSNSKLIKENLMKITLNQNDLSKLKPQTREDLLSLVFPKPKATTIKGTENFEWEGVIDFTLNQIESFISGCSEQTTKGLRVFAENGPVIHASLLNTVGITNYGSFQGSCTKRARTISGQKDAFLFSWDDWDTDKNDGLGHYAVSEMTFRSLRKYFELV